MNKSIRNEKIDKGIVNCKNNLNAQMTISEKTVLVFLWWESLVGNLDFLVQLDKNPPVNKYDDNKIELLSGYCDHIAESNIYDNKIFLIFYFIFKRITSLKCCKPHINGKYELLGDVS